MNSYGAMFFNPNLFVINGSPMNFFLDGFDNHEVNEIARIIEAFGGKLTMPDEGTIIFSEPGRLATTDYSRFHIQCLHDSIVARQFQDLEQYRIPLIKRESLDEELANQSMRVDQNASSNLLNPSPEDSLLKPWKIVSVSSHANGEQRYSFDSSDSHPEPGKNSWTADADADSETSEYSKNKVAKVKRHSLNASKVNGHVASSSVIENVKKGHSLSSKRKRIDDSELSDTSIESNGLSHKRRRSQKGKHRWSEEEDRLLIQYMIDHDAAARGRGLKVWQDIEAERILVDPYRSAQSMYAHFVDNLRFNLPKYIQDPDVLEKFKENTGGRSKTSRGSETVYSKEENKSIVKYLIEHKAIPLAYGKEIWKQMEAENIFLTPYRTAKSLRRQFIDEIQHNMSRYTHDMSVIRKLEDLRRQRPRQNEL